MTCVLIVEDDLPIRGLLQDFLAGEGFETLLAEDGRAGVELARSARPDLILMDIMLPVLDGLSAIRLLRQDAGTCDLPIVAMSANPMLARGAEPAAADAVIAKPFDLDVLLDIVLTHTGPRL